MASSQRKKNITPVRLLEITVFITVLLDFVLANSILIAKFICFSKQAI